MLTGQSKKIDNLAFLVTAMPQTTRDLVRGKPWVETVHCAVQVHKLMDMNRSRTGPEPYKTHVKVTEEKEFLIHHPADPDTLPGSFKSFSFDIRHRMRMAF